MRDPYVKKAREEDWRCRSAFKLLEIDDKHKLLKPGLVVVDCGCAPGSWTQVVVKRTNAKGEDAKLKKGFVIGIDLQHMMPIDGANLLFRHDITLPKTQDEVLDKLDGRKVDLVLSDIAPARSSNKELDHDKIIELSSSVVRFSTVVMKEGGTFLCKIWSGGKQKLLEDVLCKLFQTVKLVKPPSSRADSAEIYLLAKGFRMWSAKKEVNQNSG